MDNEDFYNAGDIIVLETTDDKQIVGSVNEVGESYIRLLNVLDVYVKPSGTFLNFLDNYANTSKPVTYELHSVKCHYHGSRAIKDLYTNKINSKVNFTDHKVNPIAI